MHDLLISWRGEYGFVNIRWGGDACHLAIASRLSLIPNGADGLLHLKWTRLRIHRRDCSENNLMTLPLGRKAAAPA